MLPREYEIEAWFGAAWIKGLHMALRALQSAAQDLERQRATDSLKKGLGKRPERDELVERMIYPT